MKTRERNLYKTKWWDHKLITQPDLATLCFVGHWVKEHAFALKRAGLDHTEDAEGKAVPVPYPYTRATVEYFQQVNGGADWRAFQRIRMLADQHGVPYDLMATAATAAILGTDCARLDVRTLDNTMMLAAVMNEVRDRLCVLSTPMTSDPYFSAANYIGTPLQDAYCADVVARIKERWGAKADDVLIRLSLRGKIPQKYFFTLQQRKFSCTVAVGNNLLTDTATTGKRRKRMSESNGNLEEYFNLLPPGMKKKCAMCNNTLAHVVTQAMVATGSSERATVKVLADQLNEGAAQQDVVTAEQLRARARLASGRTSGWVPPTETTVESSVENSGHTGHISTDQVAEQVAAIVEEKGVSQRQAEQEVFTY